MAQLQHRTPADAITLLLNCTQEHLAERQDAGELPVPQHILLGAEGVGIPYGCCEGILMVESRGKIMYDRTQQSHLSNIAGCEPCDAVPHNMYRVTFKMCAPPFDGSRTDGAPPDTDARNTLAQRVMTETWLLFEHLTCCIPCEFARVLAADHMIENGCAKFWVDIKMEHEICC